MNISPLFRKMSSGSATQIDALNSTDVNGIANLAGVTSGASPQSTLYLNKDGGNGSYNVYSLTTGGQWQLSGTSTTVPILFGEGFFLNNSTGSDQSWTVPLTIWE